MNLKQLTAALLPPESRENILGDLEERGFRLRDAASIVLLSNASAVHRDWFGPVPNLSTATDERILLRTEQILRSRRLFLAWMLAGYLPRLAAYAGAPFEFSWSVILFIVLRLFLQFIPFGGQRDPREHYRAALRSGTGGMLGSVIGWRGWCTFAPEFVRSYLIAVGAVLLFSAALYRLRRYQQELNHSPGPSPVPRILF